MIKYFNTRQYGRVETIDQIDRKDFKTYKEYIAELRRLKSEYAMAGIDIYLSQRCTNDWKN